MQKFEMIDFEFLNYFLRIEVNKILLESFFPTKIHIRSFEEVHTKELPLYHNSTST